MLRFSGGKSAGRGPRVCGPEEEGGVQEMDEMDGNGEVANVEVVDDTQAPAKADAKARKRTTAKLESQDDLGYVTGKHDPAEAEKQVRSPASRRPQGKAKDQARGERR